MINKTYKIFALFLILITSQLIISCSEGDRGFVALPQEPEPEEVEELSITGSAVKGPLTNADIRIYKLELSEGEIGEYNSALKAWFDLLDVNEVTLGERSTYTLGSISAEDVLNNLISRVTDYGYVTELKEFKKTIDDAETFDDAKPQVTKFLSDETNAAVTNEVQTIFNDVATLGELKKEVGELETLVEQLNDVDSFSEARSLLTSYQAQESDANKLKGFTFVLNELNRLSREASGYSASRIHQDFTETIYNPFINSFALEDDPVAKQNIVELKEKLEASSNVADSQKYIELASRKEGNIALKSSLSVLNSSIVTLDDFKNLVLSHESFYHNYNLKSYFTASSSFDSVYTLVTQSLQENLDKAFRNSLIRKDKDDEFLNALSFGVSNEKGVLEGLKIGEYRGFVYLQAKATNQTIDLNSGKKPLIQEMETIFHTDDILGYGDNNKESRSVYFLLDGEIQRDSDGNILKTNTSILTSGKRLITVRPSYAATPLTNLSIDLTLQSLKDASLIRKDSNLDGMLDDFISEATLKENLNYSADVIKKSLGITELELVDLFSTPATRQAHMQYFPDQELNAIKHRYMIENYSSFILDLMKVTNLNESEIQRLLAEDLTDEQIDGFIFNQSIDDLKEITELSYLAQKNPTERLVPDTAFQVSDVFFLMNEEFSTTLPEEAINVFTANRSDITIFGPAGGIDNDGDGILNNEDAFPNDSTKSKNIDAGYAGIWSVNVDASNTGYMPFNSPFVFDIQKQQVEGNCVNAPCIGMGDVSVLVIDDYSIISAPLNHDMKLTEDDDANTDGFTAFATVPGDYLIRATFTTSVAPTQSFNSIIPIKVIDPKSLDIIFDPVDPAPGDPVSVKIKATAGLCELYSVCNGIDLNSNQNQYIDIALFGDVFSVNQEIERSDLNLPYTDVLTSLESGDSLSNLEYSDSVQVSVRFSAENRNYIIGSNSSVVGSSIDSDNDLIPDSSDFFPNDSSCSLEKDGILDTNFDLEINNLDTPKCFESYLSEVSEVIDFDVNFLNETWIYNPSWHFIIRKNKYSAGFNGHIKTPTRQGTKQKISIFKESPTNKRVYFAYQNGAIDFISLEEQEVQDFLQPRSFYKVNSLNLLGKFLLVEYINEHNSTNAFLFSDDGSVAEITASRTHPKPGEPVSITINGLNIDSATNSLLKVDWTLEREEQLGNVVNLPVQLSSDNFTLQSGQTAFEDVINLSFSFDANGNPITFSKKIFVLGFDKIEFEGNIYEPTNSLKLNMIGADLASSLYDNSDLFVNWYKYDSQTEKFSFSLSDKTYPFVYEETNFELGDRVQAQLMLKHGGLTDILLVDTFDAFILGDVNDLRPRIDPTKTNINLPDRNLSYTLLPAIENADYLVEPYFVPVWYINGVAVQGENSYTFPILDTTSLKYGDTLSVSYKYDVNGTVNETNPITIITIESNRFESLYELTKKVYEHGTDAVLDPQFFSETALENLEARWFINGTLIIENADEIAESDAEPIYYNEFHYPADRLSYGDRIELQLLPKGSALSSGFSHIAEAFVGVNLNSFQTPPTDLNNNLDSDNDGVPNYLDYFRYDDQCAMASEGNPDDLDNDGISDLNELTGIFITDPTNSDSDNDGLNDFFEQTQYTTSPDNTDTDGDGYNDGVEYYLGTNPNDPADPVPSLADNDFDGLSNDDELVNNTKVNVFDTDADGLSDWFELNNGLYITDPLLSDSDNDNLSDGVELRITKSNPLDPDTDGDGLNDGLEVALGLLPTEDDSDSDGVLDSNELGYDFTITLPKIFNEADLVNYENNFSKQVSVPRGTCFKSWLADNTPNIVEHTEIEQLNSNSYQELAFASQSWDQVLRYNAQSKQFLKPINLADASNQEVESVEFSLNDPDLIYLGFSDGTISVFNSLTNTLTSLFTSNIDSPITKIIDQGSYLLTEQKTVSGIIHHSFFDLSSTNKAAVATNISNYSIENTAWLDASRLELIIFDPNYSSTSFIIDTIDFNSGTPTVSSAFIELNSVLAAPVYIEEIGGDSILRFGSGQGVNLTTNTLITDSVSPFSAGFEHQSHRVLAQANSTFVEMTTLQGVNNDFWQFRTQLENPNLLSLTAVGSHLLAISYEFLGADNEHNQISFETIILGDGNTDGLPDWWQRLSSNLDSADFNNYRLTNDASVPDFLDGRSDEDDSTPPINLSDSDGDGICDHWEESLFNTNPLLQDTDNDGMLDSQEVGLLTSSPLDCSLYPQFNIISDPTLPDSDFDGLSDGQEYFTYNTELLSPDTDLDGLTDYQELFITGTNPLIAEPVSFNSDSDGLTDVEELNKYNTDHTNHDSDNDGLNDYDEVFVFGTNPNSSDSDGDGLSDSYEVSTDATNLYLTDPSSIDSDQDGLTDFEEVDFDNVRGFVTNPINSDTDSDGVSDFDEVTNEFIYSEDLLVFLNSNPAFANPKTKSDPNLKDSDGDGICDRWETSEILNTNPAEPDTDGDNLIDSAELGINVDLTQTVDCENSPILNPISDPATPDTDGDNILDGDEVNILFTDPQDKDSDDNGIEDGLEDPDSDRLTNYQEIYKTSTNPFVADSDGNGINDDLEDLDGDMLSNYDELYLHNTNPLNIDTDGNGINDDIEIEKGLDPNSLDTDDDGISDFDELNAPDPDFRTDPLNPDSDGDGLKDGDELSAGTLPNDPDTDNDFILDGNDDEPLRHDVDLDGIIDGVETLFLNTQPDSADTDSDSLADNYEVWVYAFVYDNENSRLTDTLLTTGTFNEAVVNSNQNVSSWPLPLKFTQTSIDKQIFDLTDPSDSSKIIAKLFIHKYSDPANQDSDNDGLLDATEFKIESVYGTNYSVDKNTNLPNAISAYALNSDNFKISNPWSAFSNPILDTDQDGIPDYYEINYTFTNHLLKDTDANSVSDADEDKDLDGLTNLQEVMMGSDPNVFDLYFDSDGDGLPDIIETKLFDDYDMNLADSNSNGFADGIEDPDQDLLTNLEELRLQTDPLSKNSGLDTDNDGLTDYQEFIISGGLSSIDSVPGDDNDNDGVTNIDEINNGTDPNIVNTNTIIPDTDNDGLTDYQETYMTLTDPSSADSNGSGINDAQEDIDSDGLTNFQEVNLGTDPLTKDSQLLKTDSDFDGLVDIYETKITLTNPLEFDTGNNGLSDSLKDPDLDGFSNALEIAIGTDPLVFNLAIDTDSDGLTDVQELLLTSTDPNDADSDNDGVSDGDADYDSDGVSNVEELKLLRNPFKIELTDAQRDADNDLYINILDQNDENTDVTNPDSDSDSVLDGIEALILKTDSSLADTDEDGLFDQEELKTWFSREITNNDTCNSAEIRTNDLSGKEYCSSTNLLLLEPTNNPISTSWVARLVAVNEACTDQEVRLTNDVNNDFCIKVEYESYPTLADSDNDGIADRQVDSQGNVLFDNYPLDPSCHVSTDGFVKPDQTIQCFSSWMSEEENIQIIEAIEWNDQARVLLYASGWDFIIGYNLITKSYDLPINILGDISDIVFSPVNNTLYILYSNSTIYSYNFVTGMTQLLGDYALADNNAQQLIILNNSRLFLQFKNDFSGVYTSNLINLSNGALLDSYAGHALNLSENADNCIGVDCSVYGFLEDESGKIINLGAINVDLQSDTIEPTVRLSDTLSAVDDISGPIKLSQSENSINLGSGQILNLNLQGSDTSNNLSIEFSGNLYSQYYDFSNIFDYFVGVVDFDTQLQPGSSEAPSTSLSNGTLVQDLSSEQVNFNTYLLPPASLDEQILKLLDFSNINGLDVVYVSKFTNEILIENFGLKDSDGDGMPAIYEMVNNLDDTDPNDKFNDPDEDGLVNIEEYKFATDSQSTDTDNDGWSDLYEVLNNTSPVDALDF